MQAEGIEALDLKKILINNSAEYDKEPSIRLADTSHALNNSRSNTIMPTFKSKEFVKLKSLLPSVSNSLWTSNHDFDPDGVCYVNEKLNVSLQQRDSKIYQQIQTMKEASKFEVKRENRIRAQQKKR